ncbi:hypothetical protein B484DRAFT_440864, partial [Ochromonadaceae sp. CCMP2298]
MPRLLKGVGDGYVDDFFGCSLRWLRDGDMAAIEGFFRALLGEGAIAAHKSLGSRNGRLDIIGWLFDLLQRHVTLSAKCLEKALHGLISVNEFLPMRIKVVQRLASWG